MGGRGAYYGNHNIESRSVGNSFATGSVGADGEKMTSFMLSEFPELISAHGNISGEKGKFPPSPYMLYAEHNK